MWPDPTSLQRLDEIRVRAADLSLGDPIWQQAVVAATTCEADMAHGAHVGSSDAKKATDVATAHTRIMLANPVFKDVFDPLNHGGGGGAKAHAPAQVAVKAKKKPKAKSKKNG